MTLVFLLLTSLPAIAGVMMLVWTFRGLLRLPLLAATDLPDGAAWPTLDIISPACNEARHVQGAVTSMLASDYPSLRVIVVDDRSTDGTGPLLDALAAQEPRLDVTHLTELREGWLGKLNALQRGVERSSADWLLFMDADAHLAPQALKRAVSHAARHGIDCLSVIPEIATCGFVGDAVFDVSLALLSADDRLRSVSDPASSKVAATGAFILVRRSALERTPGFSWLRLEVADDFGLALLIKSHGGRCDIVNGRAVVMLEWYESFGQMTIAMQKNLFAIMGRFSLVRSIAIAVVAIWMALSCSAMAMPVEPGLLVVPAVGFAATTAATLLAARATGRRLLPALAWPIGFLGMAWMTLRAGIVGWRIGGIEWRGVVYPSSLLASAQRVRL